ncbi:MAG: transposase [Okeania sp. SIO3B5]|uniref:zinc ribbon domain-containing protein n=1 Tax=Okeania sp. SIO3B5 TaxID=2607811 RepID=UPI0013FEAC31|nr:zinc ribbon domain-containing protein [Okeania sp. SIO3B5]NEO58239.1 transposase [Okeania sp. SIO3B5]
MQHHIARKGFYEFRQRLTTKIVSSCGTVVLTDQWFPSSKTCHNCGRINQKLKLKDRTFDCPHCGMKIDRDLNATLVLSQYGEFNEKNRVGCARIYACELEEGSLPG